MILRRLKVHVERENWFAVFIDFCIVVIGVFIGIQVANWNESRQERTLEVIYLERLHNEATTGLSGLLASTDNIYTQLRHDLDRAYEIIFDMPGSPTQLTPEQCNAIAGTDSIIAFPFQFPSLEEMNSAGRLSIISDPELRTALTQYVLMQRNSASLVTHYDSENISLALLFPELFQLGHTQGNSDLEPQYQCDLDGMRTNTAFHHHLVQARERLTGYYNLVLRNEVDSVRDIHTRLEETLGDTALEFEG